ERDSESGLDHTWFRQYANSQGRWTTPDPYMGSMDFTNPQSLNRYAYVGNSPLTFIDPTGLNQFGGCDASEENCGEFDWFDGSHRVGGGGGGGSTWDGNLIPGRPSGPHESISEGFATYISGLRCESMWGIEKIY